MAASLEQLLQTLPQVGRVEWIGLRLARSEPLRLVNEVEAVPGKGLVGDRARGGPREVTLIQAEHLGVLGSLLHRGPVDPGLLRRNILVSWINLLALKDRQFCIGEAMLEFTGQAHPCSRMEEALGPGGLNAMRGHGGITARVLRAGLIRTGDSVSLLAVPATPSTDRR